jgi:hypothetical protein
MLPFSSDAINEIYLLVVTGVTTNTRCGFPAVRTNALIFNGQDTAHGQWPWHAAIYQYKGFDTVYSCGGSLIGTKTIITGE